MYTREDMARAWEEGFQRAETTRGRRKRSDLVNPYRPEQEPLVTIEHPPGFGASFSRALLGEPQPTLFGNDGRPRHTR